MNSNILAPWFVTSSCIGFSGSRNTVPEKEVSLAVSLIPAEASVAVGCANGVDEYVRALLKRHNIPFNFFSVSSGKYGKGRSAYALRSIACVNFVAKFDNGLWLSFPSYPCPSIVIPSPSSSRCFCGSGAGTWASLAFAIGSEVKSLVFLGSIPCPFDWNLVPFPNAPGWFSFLDVFY